MDKKGNRFLISNHTETGALWGGTAKAGGGVDTKLLTPPPILPKVKQR